MPPAQMRPRGPSSAAQPNATRTAMNARPITNQSVAANAGAPTGPRAPMGPGVARPAGAAMPNAQQVSCPRCCIAKDDIYTMKLH